MTVTKRETSETSIRVELKTGGGVTRIETGNGFLDHMLSAFARYSGLALDVKASSDLKHHLVEDVALTLGRAFRAIIPAGAARYGNRVVPMDDALVQVSVDIGGRPYYEGPLPNRPYGPWMPSFSHEAGAPNHVIVPRGSDRH